MINDDLSQKNHDIFRKNVSLWSTLIRLIDNSHLRSSWFFVLVPMEQFFLRNSNNKTIVSHVSRDGFYGIDQSATSVQGLEYTIHTLWWVECVPGPLKRGQEKCSCPLLIGLERIRNAFLPAFFFRADNIDKAFVRPAVQWWVKCWSSLQRKRGLHPWTRLPWPCSMRKEHRTPLVERPRSGLASQEVAWHRKDLFEEKPDLDATSKKLARGRTFMGP